MCFANKITYFQTVGKLKKINHSPFSIIRLVKSYPFIYLKPETVATFM